jgi:hypothetical protein
MEKHWLWELVGYTASVLIAVSMMMSSIVRLRVINLLGAVAFTVYGFCIGAYPVAGLNAFIVVVNLGFLWRLLRAQEYFQLLELKPDSVYLPYFLKFYRAEVLRAVPDFVHQPTARQLAVFILRDCSPVGVLLAEQSADGVLRVTLDFVIPNYREVKIGRFLFVEQAEFFRSRGVKEIVITPRTAEFGAYLGQVGFAPVGGATGALHLRY